MPLTNRGPSSMGLVSAGQGLQQIVRLLESTLWVDGLSGVEIAALAAHLRAFQAAPETVIVREGEKDAFFCLVTQGLVHIVKEGKTLGSVRPGRTFGEMSLVDGEPRSASAVAAEPTTLLMLTDVDFAELAEETPRLALKIVLKIAKLTSQRLRQTSGALLDLL